MARRFKSNWQNTALTVQRRNKWVCALKFHMAELEIYGPAGGRLAFILRRSNTTHLTDIWPWQLVTRLHHRPIRQSSRCFRTMPRRRIRVVPQPQAAMTAMRPAMHHHPDRRFRPTQPCFRTLMRRMHMMTPYMSSATTSYRPGMSSSSKHRPYDM
jgi:hypothetical protein